MIYQTKLAKWGNSYAIRIPITLVENAKLSEEESLQLSVSAEGRIEIQRKLTVDEMLSVIRKIARPLPAGYKFNREEAHARGTLH